MNRLRKLLVILFFCFVSVLQTKSQKRVSFNAGIENSFPLKPFSDYYTNGIGASAEIDYRIINKLKLYFNATYLKYSFNKTNLDVEGDEAFLPMQFGAKINVIPYVYLIAGGGVNLDFGNVITPYKVYHFGVGTLLFKHFSADIKYERTGVFDFTPKVIKLKIGYTF